MFDKIMRDATLPGAFVNAVHTARERDLEEKRRRGGYKMHNATMTHRTFALRAASDWLVSLFSRTSRKTTDADLSGESAGERIQ